MSLNLSVGKRNIKSGAEYDKYFVKPSANEVVLMKDGEIEDTLKLIAAIVKNYNWQTKRIAPILKGLTTFETCQNIWNFIYNHYQYKIDRPGVEQLRTPARSWADRVSGIDCDCMSITIACILENLNIPYVFRITKYLGSNSWQHIYIIVDNNYIIDGVIGAYNYQKKYTNKQDYNNMGTALNGMPIHLLNGVGNVQKNGMFKSAQIQMQRLSSNLDEINQKIFGVNTKQFINTPIKTEKDLFLLGKYFLWLNQNEKQSIRGLNNPVGFWVGVAIGSYLLAVTASVLGWGYCKIFNDIDCNKQNFWAAINPVQWFKKWFKKQIGGTININNNNIITATNMIKTAHNEMYQSGSKTALILLEKTIKANGEYIKAINEANKSNKTVNGLGNFWDDVSDGIKTTTGIDLSKILGNKDIPGNASKEPQKINYISMWGDNSQGYDSTYIAVSVPNVNAFKKGGYMIFSGTANYSGRGYISNIWVSNDKKSGVLKVSHNFKDVNTVLENGVKIDRNVGYATPETTATTEQNNQTNQQQNFEQINDTDSKKTNMLPIIIGGVVVTGGLFYFLTKNK